MKVSGGLEQTELTQTAILWSATCDLLTLQGVYILQHHHRLLLVADKQIGCFCFQHFNQGENIVAS